MLIDFKEVMDVERKRMNQTDFKHFKKIKKYFEAENYKQVIKGIDQIVAAKNSKNLQNIFIIKALSHYSIKEYDLAVKVSKQAISFDISNFDSWYVYGTANLGANNYEDAHKAFLQAEKTKSPKSKIGFYRDWNYLSFFRQDYQQLLHNSYYLMNLRIEFSYPVLSCAEAALRLNQYDLGLKVLDSLLMALFDEYSRMQGVSSDLEMIVKRMYINNVLLLNANLLERSLKFDELIGFIEGFKLYDIPRILFYEHLIEAYVQTKQYPIALKICKEALEFNPDNINYLETMIDIQTKIDSKISIIEFLSGILEEYPNSLPCMSIIVKSCNLEDDTNRELFIKIVKSMVQRKAYGFFKTIYHCFENDRSKLILLEDILNQCVEEQPSSSLFYLRMMILKHKNDFDKRFTVIKHLKSAECQPGDDLNMKHLLLAQENYKLGNIEHAQLYARLAVDAEKSNKFFCSKAMKYYLIVGQSSDARLIGSAFTFNLEKVDHYDYFVSTCSLKQIYYYMLCDIKLNKVSKVLEKCFTILKISNDFYSMIYDLYVLACHYGNITRISEAYQSFSYMNSSKIPFFAAALGLKICLVLSKGHLKIDYEGLPKYLKDKPLDGAHKFLKILLNSHSCSQVIHRLAADYYFAVDNQSALERSLGLIKSHNQQKIIKMYSNAAVSKSNNEELDKEMKQLTINAQNELNELQIKNIWMLNKLTESESKNIENITNDPMKKLEPILLLMLEFNKTLISA